MKTIDGAMRRRIFGLVKEAHERTGSTLPLNEWRHEQQRAVGIESLSECPAELGLKLLNRLHRCIEGEKDRRRGQAQGQPQQRIERTQPVGKKAGPAGGRPKGILEWTGDQHGQMRKVEALLTDMELPWDYADSIAKRMFGNSVLRVDTLNGHQMRAVIAALVKRQQKHGGRRTPAAISDGRAKDFSPLRKEVAHV